MNQITGKKFSIDDINNVFQEYPSINRLILKKTSQSAWEIIKSDGERPNNLSEISEWTKGEFTYERHPNLGFEELNGYLINSDEFIKVVYRLSEK